MNKRSEVGFSLVELVIVVAILAIIGAVSLQGYKSFYTASVFNGTVQNVATLITDARQNTLSSRGELQYGVHFASSTVTIFPGDTYNAVDPDNRIITLADHVEVSVISLNGGGDEVVFKRLTGETDNYGTILIKHVVDTTRTVDILIQGTGLIEVQ